MKASSILGPIALIASVSLLVIASSPSKKMTGAPTAGAANGNKAQAQPGGAEYEVDFTKMNQTMQVSHAYRLLAKPEEFEGKAMRITGVFLSYADDKTGKRYFGCMLGNGTGCSCCSIGVLDFTPRNAASWPTNFPPVESFVTVTGRLKMCEVSDGKATYKVPLLDDAEMFSN